MRKCGQVTYCTILRNEKNPEKDFAVVTFKTDMEAKEAMETFNGKLFGGTKIRIDNVLSEEALKLLSKIP